MAESSSAEYISYFAHLTSEQKHEKLSEGRRVLEFLKYKTPRSTDARKDTIPMSNVWEYEKIQLINMHKDELQKVSDQLIKKHEAEIEMINIQMTQEKSNEIQRISEQIINEKNMEIRRVSEQIIMEKDAEIQLIKEQEAEEKTRQLHLLSEELSKHYKYHIDQLETEIRIISESKDSSEGKSELESLNTLRENNFRNIEKLEDRYRSDMKLFQEQVELDATAKVQEYHAQVKERFESWEIHCKELDDERNSLEAELEQIKQDYQNSLSTVNALKEACSNYEELKLSNEELIRNLTTSINESRATVERLEKLLHQHGLSLDSTAPQIDYRETIRQLQMENSQLINERNVIIGQHTIEILHLQNDNNVLLGTGEATRNELSSLKEQINQLEFQINDSEVTLANRNGEQAALIEQHSIALQNIEQQYTNTIETKAKELNTLKEFLVSREQEILTLTTQFQLEKADLQNDNTELNESIAKLTADVNTQQESINRLHTDLNSMNESNCTIKTEYDTLNEQLSATKLSLQIVEREKDDVIINNTQLKANLSEMETSLMEADKTKQQLNDQMQIIIIEKANLTEENITLNKRLEYIGSSNQQLTDDNNIQIKLLNEELLTKNSLLEHLQQRIATLEPTVKWRGASSDTCQELKSLNEQIFEKERELATLKSDVQYNSDECTYLDTLLDYKNRQIEAIQKYIQSENLSISVTRSYLRNSS